MMPTIHPAPINEHDPNSRYMIDAFPILFPTGAADFHEHRPDNVSPQDYFKHLLRYRDDRFAQHPQFRFLLTFTMRWKKQISDFCKAKFK